MERLIIWDKPGEPFTGEQFEQAVHSSIAHSMGPGKWTIDIGSDRFVDFSPAPPGIQVSFDEGIDQKVAGRVVMDVIRNLKSLTGKSFYPQRL